MRVTERAAIAAAGWRGKGDEKAADARRRRGHAHRAAAASHIDGRIVIGEGERDEAPMLFIGEEVGAGDGPEVDIAVDPLEGTTLCAKNQPDSICVLAMAERGGLLNAPDVYMHKIAIGAGYRRRHRRSRHDRHATTSSRSPRPRACRSARSPPACSTARAMPALIEELRIDRRAPSS